MACPPTTVPAPDVGWRTISVRVPGNYPPIESNADTRLPLHYFGVDFSSVDQIEPCAPIGRRMVVIHLKIKRELEAWFRRTKDLIVQEFGLYVAHVEVIPNSDEIGPGLEGLGASESGPYPRGSTPDGCSKIWFRQEAYLLPCLLSGRLRNKVGFGRQRSSNNSHDALWKYRLEASKLAVFLMGIWFWYRFFYPFGYRYVGLCSL